MGWKVYGYMEPGNHYTHGPLPRKRWVKEKTDKRCKLAYRWHYSQRGGEDDAAFNERRAIAYAQWLAARDGLTIPTDRGIKAKCHWDGIYSAIRKRKSRRWDGSVSEQAAYLKRIRAVEWGTERKEEVYNTLKTGKRGAWLYNITHFDVQLRVEIPHWDWEPAEPQEELLEVA